ncbi:guanine nucleotide-binding protein G(T) subunit gamma-T1 [Clupea harengus]|uniref:Guanine nucleotide-binding protein subunit gamma n=1 Tax=Clupea harengus TaxID=7950 RepID=A0A6P3W0R6_CLUHA|nr:guanine nucleotide-binding protein G(T) subunit gamma-T1 [Clupea harengus]
MPIVDVENLTDLDKAKMELEQKKKEVPLERALLSKGCTEFMEAVQATADEDPLVKGIPEATNPFKEIKGGCVIC